MTLSIIYIICGGVLLYFGADWIVKGGSKLAAHFGLSPLVVGLTIVAFGTSLPELVVSLAAALKNSSNIAIGNVIGSNITNVGLVLGLSTMIFPLTIRFSRIRNDLLIYLGAASLFTYFCFDGIIERWEGAILFSGIIFYTGYSLIHPSRRVEKIIDENGSVVRYVFFLLLGGGLLYIGSNLFIEGAITLSKLLGVGEIVIGMSVVALGTSLPELATSIVAAYHKENGISVGNIIGSNLFNLLSVIGIVSLFHPLTAPHEIMFLEIPFLFAFGLILFPISFMKQPISRYMASLMIGGYGVFIILLFI